MKTEIVWTWCPAVMPQVCHSENKHTCPRTPPWADPRSGSWSRTMPEVLSRKRTQNYEHNVCVIYIIFKVIYIPKVGLKPTTLRASDTLERLNQKKKRLNSQAALKVYICLFFLIFILKNIYLFMRDTERERQRHRQREKKQAPCRKPDTGLNPGTPGSHPGPKAGTKPLSHPGIPYICL